MNDILGEVAQLVLNSKRTMPAHFMSNGDKTKTFCIDSDLIDAADEYEMANEAFFQFSNFLPQQNDSIMFLLLLGEDIMIGTYLLGKYDQVDLAETLQQELTEVNLSSFKESGKEFNPSALEWPEAQSYLNHCRDFGAMRSTGNS